MSAPSRLSAAQLSPSDLVERVLLVSTQLLDVISRETELLETQQPLKIGELQAEKIRLANEYAMDIQAISMRKELLDRAPAEKIARLKVAMTKLDVGLARNRNVLGAAKSVSERILKSVADSVNEQKTPSLGYGRNAAMTNRPGNRSAAISLDSRV
ncbi:MAG: hypothetical protein Q7S99_11070 [Parvibaculum sp.]|mgnify:FL=1|nr:hypothetical protein [Parvibaculum sp.]|tara:strand:- start:2415 stop:2882 length:468 start_codon:yes stop_codon:yes gene_type:complete